MSLATPIIVSINVVCSVVFIVTVGVIVVIFLKG